MPLRTVFANPVTYGLCLGSDHNQELIMTLNINTAIGSSGPTVYPVIFTDISSSNEFFPTGSLPHCIKNEGRLLIIKLNSRNLSEIVWLLEILCFKNQTFNRPYPKKPTGMH